MAIPTRQARYDIPDLSGEIPEKEVPVPDDVKDRFPSMAGYQQAVMARWEDFTRILKRQISELGASVATLQSSDRSTATTVTSIQSSITSINASLADLQAQITALGADDEALSPVVTSLASLSASVTNHIAATSAHGVTGDIVGTSGAQSLESKTIGLTYPKPGRFNALMVKESIDAAESITVPSGTTMFVPGGLSISGRLRVEGRVRFL
jgi:prefoldin subunit 5